ncbi:hypothetical protein ULMS_14220 [Patiriisocius marinistellae]|uniref:DUF4331 domain-containing protein n=1 Tax=Patiriisocius marinistellae TaxID=2494560 RepID=A0A5J4FXN2_9FLAO|nr:DUF4331 domain-containing protein [Patiriisocius marinistellae]GEQ85914.1 hypothetical protein ULMS_14220 [Patiriisocius marinistellae]
MKIYKITAVFVAICISLLFVQCNDDDDNANIIEQSTCSDGILNGEETGIDCGGPCEACEDTGVALDFTGTFIQEDVMGRPGVNTVFSGSDAVKDLFNKVPTAMRGTLQDGQTETFQATFQNTLELYHDVYAAALMIDPEDLDYEENILGMNAATFTTVLANFDALQVAPEGTTTYYDGTNILTGRNLNDDVIDISLTLMFGGMSGTRFDGNNGTPQLTSDGVGVGTRVFGAFPHLEIPN